MKARCHDTVWSRIDSLENTFSASCDADEPSIGPVRLLRRTTFGFEPRAVGELDFVFSAALGHSVQFADKMRGLRAVADALEKGDLARAILVTQFMWLPSLPDDQAFHRAVRADSLAKAGFNPDQARDGHSRWSDEGAGNEARDSSVIPVQELIMPDTLIPWLEQVKPVRPLAPTPPLPGEILPPAVGTPNIAVPRTLDNPYPEDKGCREEWDDARRYCGKLVAEGRLGVGDYKEHGKYYEQCLRGQISERCGGNPVDWGRGA